LLLVALQFPAVAAPQPPGPNIALGKSYTYARTSQSTAFEPNYGDLSKDNVEITDGQYAPGSQLWSDAASVVWNGQPLVCLTIDLEKAEPIGGLSYSTAGQAGNFNLPVAISLFVSDDNESFYYVDDIVRLSGRHGVPDDTEYTTHRYVADNITARGRYVRLMIRARGAGRVVTDEIEIYRGDDALLEQTRSGEPIAATDIAAMEVFSDGLITDACVRIRIRKDLAAMQHRVTASGLSYADKQAALKHLVALAGQIETFPKAQEKSLSHPELVALLGNGFRAVMPLNDVHAEILRVNARFLRHGGLPPFFAWKTNRMDPLNQFEAPERAPAAPPSLQVVAMNNEYRSTAFNLTNTTDEPQSVAVRVENLPGTGYLSVYQVEFVETTTGKIVADPLVPVAPTAEGYVVSVPAGLTRQVWLTFHPQNLKAGTYDGAVNLSVAPLGQTVELPLKLEIFAPDFPRHPALSLCMWDFANNGFGDIEDAVLSDMRAHHVDTAWGNDDVVPRVKITDIDEAGNLLAVPDFSVFDAWIKQWEGRGIRYYMVSFNGIRRVFGSMSLGSARFNRAVSQWAVAWAEHNQSLGIEPGQLAVCIWDEPSTDAHAQQIVHWAKAIKSGTADIGVFNDPVNTVKFDSADMLAHGDVHCPNIGTFSANQPKSGQVYAAEKALGKRFWVYSCSGPATLMDPYDYYRLHAWYCWKYGATGHGFWSYTASGGDSAWNPYNAAKPSFAPVYLSQTEVTSGRHWEAVREGIQDYEYLRMLSDRIADWKAQGKTGTALDDAIKLLRDIPDEVAPGDFDQDKAYQWSADKDRSVADSARRRILVALDQLR
jgi:hypothetical protein